MAFPPQRRYDLAPLERLASLVYPPSVRHPDATGVNVLLDQLGMPRINLTRWKRGGGVPECSADRLAVSLGHHPSAIWPEWWDVEAP